LVVTYFLGHPVYSRAAQSAYTHNGKKTPKPTHSFGPPATVLTFFPPHFVKFSLVKQTI